MELAVRSSDLGVISRSVLNDSRETLVHGNELLAEAGIGGGGSRNRTGYTVDAVARVLSGVGPPAPSETLPTAFDWFVGYLILDALVGNTDRHQDNWATIRGPGGERLAPSFDHASCLGFQLSDQERSERLADRGNRTVASYATAARTKFVGNPSPIDVALGALRIVGPDVRAHWVRAVDRAPDLAELAAGVPAERMNEASRRFAEALYQQNAASLSQRRRRMDA